jgi:hypothetical protein
LTAEQTLVVERGPDLDVLQIVRPDGQACLTVHVTPEGPVLRFEGSLVLEATGGLAINAQQIALHGRDGLALSSGGDARIDVAGDLHSRARIQNITAVLGNVNVKANDDVRMNGERIKMNC